MDMGQSQEDIGKAKGHLVEQSRGGTGLSVLVSPLLGTMPCQGHQVSQKETVPFSLACPWVLGRKKAKGHAQHGTCQGLLAGPTAQLPVPRTA